MFALLLDGGKLVPKINPSKISGQWREGFSLDVHTTSSICVGYNEFGHPVFENQRSEIGELLYRLKFRSDRSALPELVETAATFVEKWRPDVDVIVPVPASRARSVQPVTLVGDALAKRLNLEWGRGWVKRVKNVAELKNVFDYEERQRLLEGAFEAQLDKVEGRKVLLLDDLFRSGATMNSITEVLIAQGRAKQVAAFALTRTRKHK